MPNFGLKKIAAVRGKESFYQLTIDDDPDFTGAYSEDEKNERKKGVLDHFEDSLEKKYRKDLVQIYQSMNQVANQQHLPGQKYHELAKREKNDPYKDYEFKHGDLRVYAIKDTVGRIIILAGYKNNQKRDIPKMRSLKKQYFDSLKQRK